MPMLGGTLTVRLCRGIAGAFGVALVGAGLVGLADDTGLVVLRGACLAGFTMI